VKRLEFIDRVWTALAMLHDAYGKDPQLDQLDLTEAEWAERLRAFEYEGQDESRN
jgi:hypothetical protein